jgi:hypothetical protein
MVACEVFMAIDVTIPLVAVGPVLIALVLNDQLVRDVDEVDPANWTLVVAADQVALRYREPGED